MARWTIHRVWPDAGPSRRCRASTSRPVIPATGTVSRHAEAGYSLLEVLVVLSIIALIAAVVGPRLVGYLGKAKADTARVQMREIASAVELYFLDNGSYPSQQAGLSAMMTKPAEAKKWSGPYLKKADGLVDPWGQPYIYKIPGKSGEFEIISLGADGAPGGEGENADISTQ